MSTFEIIGIVQIAATIGVGYYLTTRIKTQDKIISRYEAVFNSTDIRRLVDYHNELDKLRTEDLTASKKRALALVDTVLQDFYDKIGRQYDELSTFVMSLYVELPQSERKAFVERHLPSCISLFQIIDSRIEAKEDDPARTESGQ